MKTWLAMVAVLFSIICGVTVVAAPDPEGLTDIDVSEPGGFVDLRLTIRSVERTANGEMAIEAYGLDHGKIVGIGAGLPAEMVAGKIDSGGSRIEFVKGITLRSLGEASDGLMVTMAHLYHVSNAPQRARSSVIATAAILQRTPRSGPLANLQSKLFFNDSDEKRYAELYLNLDLATNTLELFEKDPDYRVDVIKALAE
jgi:hypothetical protein